MSSSKVKVLKRSIGYTATWASSILSVTADSSHYLATGDLVSFIFADSPQELINVTVTVTGANTFTIPLANRLNAQSSGRISISFFRTGQTGVYSFPLPRSNGNSAVIQSFVSGTGGATYELQSSLDNIHWVPLASVVHAGTSGDTQFVTVEPSWAYIGINISVIGAGTALSVLYAG